METNHVKDQDVLTDDATIEAEIKKQMDDDGIKQPIAPDVVTDEIIAHITKLLKKRKWTGEDAGKVLVYDLTKQFGRKMSVEEKHKWDNMLEIYNQKIRNSTEENQRIYVEYMEISKWLTRVHALAGAHQQSFNYNVEKITGDLHMVQNAEFISYRIAQISRQQDPLLYSRLDKLTLDKFTAKDKEKKIEFIESAREIVLKEFYFMRGYCKVIELIADYLKINALNTFQARMQLLYAHIMDINLGRKKTISDIDNYAPEDKKINKLEMLKKVFKPIEITWKISESTTNTAKDKLRKKEVFMWDALYFLELFTTEAKP